MYQCRSCYAIRHTGIHILYVCAYMYYRVPGVIETSILIHIHKFTIYIYICVLFYFDGLLSSHPDNYMKCTFITIYGSNVHSKPRLRERSSMLRHPLFYL